MAQCAATSAPTVTRLGWVRKPKSRERLSLNDTEYLQMPNLQFDAEKTRVKREDDLSWQIKFAQMKLKSWSNVDNTDWVSLDKLLKVAQTEVSDLNPA